MSSSMSDIILSNIKEVVAIVLLRERKRERKGIIFGSIIEILRIEYFEQKNGKTNNSNILSNKTNKIENIGTILIFMHI